jgi:antitoxin MazE
MRSKLIRIGNSRGLRLSKSIIDAAGLQEDVDIQVREGALVIRSGRKPRRGWADAARRLRERGEDGLLDAPSATRFDEEDWRWR